MQVVATLAVVAYTVMAVTGCSGPASIVLGGGLALSSTAVAMQVISHPCCSTHCNCATTCHGAFAQQTGNYSCLRIPGTSRV